ncbi:glycosyltransferase [uncultured Azohydromonas sp.]|uniref:glycosyltransferase family 2 protein n=1 Tax=uncultured Azohydromonas sp. TaxID=487342 RepID=UPI002623A236|nr:glycosyltransferase [uncultured Azohydromonas sp.]
MQITTLIPAYKTQYIPDLLNGLRLQTSPVGRVLISDDSPDGIFRRTLYSPPYAPLLEGLDIEFHEGPRNGAYENVKHLVRLWNGRSELVHILFDDDVLYPEFYERHLLAHASGDFSCSVSRRWQASETGMPIAGQPVPPAIQNHPHRMLSLDDGVLFMTTTADCKNWLGEFSNAVFRADCADLLLQPRLGVVSYAGLWDLGAFLAASTRRPLCHIQDHLGYFRLGPAQNSSKADSPYMKAAILGYAALTLGGHLQGRLSAEQARSCWAKVGPVVALHWGRQADVAPLVPLVMAMARGEPQAQERFLEAWHGFLGSHGFL